MTTQQQFKINGVIDTSRSNMDNLQILANNCGSWISFDENSGKWGVVINQAGTSAYSFTDDDIIGSISLASASLDNVYNSVEVTYPNLDIEGGTDSITLALPAIDWYTNELPNQKQLNYSLCDNSIQAQYLAYLHLNQSRQDEVVKFLVTFGNIDIKAGDIFDITNSAYSWTNREFRAIKVVEKENNGDMFLEVTGVAYAAATYNITDIVNYERTFNDGILAIGTIGQAGTPQVTKFEQGARPHILIESVVPDSGDNTTVVTDMEFHVYIMPDSELPNWELVDDSTRTYTLLTTQTSSSGTYAPGDTALIDIGHLNNSNFLVKARARNDQVTGPFSDASGLVTYTPAQTPDRITDDVEWYDILGQQILGMTLMKGLEDLFTGNLTGPGSLYDKVFSLFEDDPTSGNRLANSGAVTSTYVSNNSYVITSPYDSTFTVDNVVFPETGIYEVFVYGNFAATGAAATGDRGIIINVDGNYVNGSVIGTDDYTISDVSPFGTVTIAAGTHPVELNIWNNDSDVATIDVSIMIHYLGPSV